MKRETAIKRIKKAVDKTCKLENQKVKDYIAEIIYLMYTSLELDNDEYDYTSSQNLNFAIEVNLEDEYYQLVREARGA